MQEVIDGKKLSVKHYLNDKVKPIEWFKNPEVGLFPIYTQVIYDKTSTKFRTDHLSESGYSKDFPPNPYVEYHPFDSPKILLPLGEQYEQDLKTDCYKEEIRQIESKIIRVAKFEVQEPSIQFNLTGFSERLRMYYQEMGSFMEDKLWQPSILYLGDYVPYNVLANNKRRRGRLKEVIEKCWPYLPPVSEMPWEMKAILGLSIGTDFLAKTKVIDFLQVDFYKIVDQISNLSRKKNPALSPMMESHQRSTLRRVVIQAMKEKIEMKVDS